MSCQNRSISKNISATEDCESAEVNRDFPPAKFSIPFSFGWFAHISDHRFLISITWKMSQQNSSVIDSCGRALHCTRYSFSYLHQTYVIVGDE
jgi:hypothetical protein